MYNSRHPHLDNASEISISSLHWHSSGPFGVSSIACFMVTVLFHRITRELLQKSVKVFWLVRLLIKIRGFDQTLYPPYLFPQLSKLFTWELRKDPCAGISFAWDCLWIFFSNLEQHSFIPLPGCRPLGRNGITCFIQIWRRAWRSGNCRNCLLLRVHVLGYFPHMLLLHRKVWYTPTFLRLPTSHCVQKGSLGYKE